MLSHGDSIYDQKFATSFPGSLFSASLSRWNRDPGNEVEKFVELGSDIRLRHDPLLGS